MVEARSLITIFIDIEDIDRQDMADNGGCSTGVATVDGWSSPDTSLALPVATVVERAEEICVVADEVDAAAAAAAG